MKNLRQRINAHCKSCIYDPEDSLSWRQQVESCTCTGCEFWDIRPIPVAVNVNLPMIDKDYLFSDDMPNSPSEPLRAIIRH